MKWLAIQPLIGGMVFGAYKALNTWPEYIISNGAENEIHLLNYFKEHNINVPYLSMYNDYSKFNNKNDENIKFKDIDIVVSIPICSGLSLINTSKSRGANAEQNDNMYNITTLALEKIKPKCFIFENAPALYTKSGALVVDNLFNIAKKNNYSMSLIKTDTFLHGIPQHRHRTFAIFWKLKYAPIVNFYNIENIGLIEYLKKIDNNLQHEIKKDIFKDPHFNFIIKKFGNDFRNIMLKNKQITAWQLIEKNKLLDEFIEYSNNEKLCKCAKHIKNKIKNGKSYWDSSLVYTGNYVNAIIGKSMWSYIHPTENRFYSIRELMHLMGLPNDMKLINPFKNFNHIAQNVPVNTAADWINECKKFINNELEFSNVDFIKQNNEKQQIDTKINNINIIEEFF